LDAVARLVGELAEVDLPGVRRLAEHVDVGAREEDAAPAAREDDSAHLRLLEAEALEGVVELDVDAEVVRVQLELVAGADAAVFVAVHRDGGDGAVDGDFPVAVAGGIDLVVDPAGP